MIGNSKEYDFDKITDFENIYKAYKKAKKGKGFNKSRLKFEVSALDGVLQIKELLATKQFNVSPYNKFTIYEPKERVIEAGSFKDKIVQHSICDNVLLPSLQNEFLPHNYAGQQNKGTRYGLNCLKENMMNAYNKYGYDCWIIKGDIRKYFYSIRHEKLKDIVQYHIRDKDVYWLCEKFIDSTEGIGLPLGNQITQVFALLFLSGLDHFITGELGVEFYGRYMDDFYLIVKNKSYAIFCLDAIKAFVSSLDLEVNEKTQLIPFKNGIKFCGFHTYITKDGKCIRKLSNLNKRAKKKKYKRMAYLVNHGKLSKEKFLESYKSWKDHVSQGNTVKLRYEMDQYIERLLMK